MDLPYHLFAKRQNLVLARDVSRADEPTEALTPHVGGKIPLGLDIEVAVFHLV
jgi:hypothetical protein